MIILLALCWMLVGFLVARVVDVLMYDPIMEVSRIPDDPWYGVRFFLSFWIWPGAIFYYVMKFWLESRAERGR